MILDEIVAAKRRAHAARDPEADATKRAFVDDAAPIADGEFRRALARDGALPAVIAEFKRRSPSAGAIAPDADVLDVARAYEAAGAAALSVLTDAEFFGGSLDDLGRAARTSLPVLRKDFVLFDEDVVDAAAGGADAVLLIARILDDAALARLGTLAQRYGLDALVEVHDAAELERALAAGATLVGVNHRDLDTLRIDLDLSERLASRFPSGVVRVAESGLRTRDELGLMRARGYHAVLVGEALMRAPSPGAALRALVGGA